MQSPQKRSVNGNWVSVINGERYTCLIVTRNFVNKWYWRELRTRLVKNFQFATVLLTDSHIHGIQCESKKSPPATCGFLTFFHIPLRILNQFFTHLLYVPIYARLQIFIQLSQILTQLCHIKRDYLVHIICVRRRTWTICFAEGKRRMADLRTWYAVVNKSIEILVISANNLLLETQTEIMSQSL